jgi:predicted phage terminase large subunit-like protein
MTSVPTDTSIVPADTMMRNFWRGTPALMASYLTNGKYLVPPHIEFLCDILIDAANNPDKRVMVTFPPRHGKSECTSHWFPIWYLTHNPEKRVILCSYEADFAASWGRKVRNDIQLYGNELQLNLRQDTIAAARWETNMGGGMITAGVGGPIVGRGADIFIIDDPVKNSEEANSETIREKHWEWWRGPVYSRLEPRASVVLVLTRWHDDDLAGRILQEMAKGGEEWECVNLPALAEEGDPLGRSVGDPLWSERYDINALARIKKSVGSRNWSALYQQRPTPLGGGMFKQQWFRYYESTEAGNSPFYTLKGRGEPDKRVFHSDCWRFLSCDLAWSEKTMADYTVIQVWDVVKKSSDMILVNQFRAQIDHPEVEAQMESWLKRYKPVFIGIEDRTSGSVAIQRFRRDGITVKSMKADRDKVTRAIMPAIWMENGKVFFPQESAYLVELESELLKFNKGAHDDQVDALSYAVAFANNRNLWEEKVLPDLPPMSYGAILGMDKVFSKGNKREPLWFNDDDSGNSKSLYGN